MENLQGMVLIIGGIFAMFCSFKDYDFFMNNHKAKFFVDLFGRNGTRAFYFVLGFFLLIAGMSAIR